MLQNVLEFPFLLRDGPQCITVHSLTALLGPLTVSTWAADAHIVDAAATDLDVPCFQFLRTSVYRWNFWATHGGSV